MKGPFERQGVLSLCTFRVGLALGQGPAPGCALLVLSWFAISALLGHRVCWGVVLFNTHTAGTGSQGKHKLRSPLQRAKVFKHMAFFIFLERMAFSMGVFGNLMP